MDKTTREEFIEFTPEQEVTQEQVVYSARDAIITHQLVGVVQSRLESEKLEWLWDEIEKPLIHVMIDMELNGVDIDHPKLQQLHKEKTSELAELLFSIREETAKLPGGEKYEEFAPSSGPQCIEVLRKSGILVPSCEKGDLQTALSNHPESKLLKMIIDYRKLHALITKFIEAWPKKYISPVTSKIHASFNGNGTVTGRMACSSPNMLAVDPVMRPLIIAPEGHSIITADYNQYELRALAGATKEPYFVQSFEGRKVALPRLKKLAQGYGFDDYELFVKAVDKGTLSISEEEHKIIHEFSLTDVHKMTASLIFDVPVEAVTPQFRKVGKCVALNTTIHTKKGAFPLRELLPRKVVAGNFYPLKDVEVMTDEGWKQATEVYYSGPMDGVRIVTGSGRSITCSLEHKFRTLDSKGAYVWKKASKLKEGDTLFIKPYLLEDSGPKRGRKPPFDYFKVGAYIGALLGSIEPFGPFPRGSEIEKTLLALGVKLSLRSQSGLIIDQSFLDYLAKNFELKVEKEGEVRLEALPQAFLNNSEFMKGMASQLASYHPLYINKDKKKLLNSLLRVGQYAFDRDSIVISRLSSKKDLRYWKRFLPLTVLDRYALDLLTVGSTEKGLDYLKDFCTETEYETTVFLEEHGLRRDVITSITPVKNVPMGDVSVPENNTVMYEGFISHNTMNYCLLYGGQANVIVETLAKDGIIYSLNEANLLRTKYFNKLKNIEEFIAETHKEVLKNGYVATFLGRRRYFPLPPKWQASYYKKMKEAAFRESVNHKMQGSNADATKLSDVRLRRIFKEKYGGNPRIVLVVHDENVIVAADAIAEEVALVVEEEMNKAGSEAMDGFLSEVSLKISKTWTK